MAGDEASSSSGGCCTGSITIQSIIWAIWTPISIALIVVGAIHKNDCEAEPYIPIYMIVAGAFFLGFWLLLPLECCCPTLGKIVSMLVGLFLFAWFIAGSVWVFRIYPLNDRKCDRGTYLFAFSILIIQWIFIGIGVIATLIGCLCCQNSCASNTCGGCQSCLECCECSSCLQSCSCLESGCGCMQCCDSCQSLCCCCKSVQCSSCLNCSMCAQCCKCLECCAVKA